jgi:hypothetical protein
MSRSTEDAPRAAQSYLLTATRAEPNALPLAGESRNFTTTTAEPSGRQVDKPMTTSHPNSTKPDSHLEVTRRQCKLATRQRPTTFQVRVVESNSKVPQLKILASTQSPNVAITCDVYCFTGATQCSEVAGYNGGK